MVKRFLAYCGRLMVFFLLEVDLYLMFVIFRHNLFELRDRLTILTAIAILFLLFGTSQLIRSWAEGSLRTDWFVPFLHGLERNMLFLTLLQMTRLRYAIPVIPSVFLAYGQ